MVEVEDERELGGCAVGGDHEGFERVGSAGEANVHAGVIALAQRGLRASVQGFGAVQSTACFPRKLKKVIQAACARGTQRAAFISTQRTERSDERERRP